MAAKERIGFFGRLWLGFTLFFKMIFDGRLAFWVKEVVASMALGGDESGETQGTSTMKVRTQAPPPPVDPGDVALALLSALQRDGRFIDFISESLEGFSDAQVGAVAREIHGNCKKVVDRYVDLSPVWPAEEESQVVVEEGFDPARIQLSGNVVGDPPFTGVLRHRGWVASDFRPPRLTKVNKSRIIAPAEVEV